jgi:NAD(P)H-flavin reductase
MKPARFAPEPVRTAFVETAGSATKNGLIPGTRLWWLELAVGPAFPEPVPGQFVMLSPPASRLAGFLLPRPFSIARAVRDGDGWRLGILYSRVGRGTDLMSRAGAGAWSVLGPLGRGFPTAHKGPALLVGGGRGTAPLVFLAEWLEARGRSAEFLVGARSAEDWAGPEEMGVTLARTRVWAASEDGSRGHKGRVLELFAHESELGEALAKPGAAIHVCGPHGLLEATGAMGEGFGRARPRLDRGAHGVRDWHLPHVRRAAQSRRAEAAQDAERALSHQLPRRDRSCPRRASTGRRTAKPRPRSRT